MAPDNTPIADGADTQRRLQENLKKALAAVDANPKDGNVWISIGVLRTFLGTYDDAVEAFNRALKMGITMPEPSWLAMAISGNRSGRYEAALHATEQLTRLYEKEPVYWALKAMLLDSLGRPKDEKAALERLTALKATDESRSFHALALGLLGRYDEALQMDDEAINALQIADEANKAVREQRAYAMTIKGMHLAKRAAPGDSDATDKTFSEAIRLAPGDHWIGQAYGVALGDLKRYGEAQRVLEEVLASVDRALELEPANAALRNRKGAILRSLAFVLTKLGKHERALERDTAAVAVEPHNPMLWRSKGVDLFNLDRVEEALQAFNQAVNRAPGHADMWLAKGSALWKLGQYEDSADAFTEAARLDEELTNAWVGLGASLDALGRHREAVEKLRKAVALDPERPELWPTLGRAYRGLQNAKAGEQAFRRGFALDHSMVTASGVVDALAAQNREHDALVFLRKNVPRDADDALLAYWRGVLLARLNREDEAVAEFAAAARRWAKDGVRDARATASARALHVAEARGTSAASWADYWFGRHSTLTTRILGAMLLLGLMAELAAPLVMTDALLSLSYGSSWAAIILPVTVLVLLLALPTVQSIKAGGGSFEITAAVVSEDDQLGFALPSDIPLEKIPDLPRLDADAARKYSDHLNSLLQSILDSVLHPPSPN
jgi:tetratricopeptide (TPR) repeat protein